MDYYSILDNNPAQAGPEIAPPDIGRSDLQPRAENALVAREALRFPGEDGGKSLSEMAQRDLDATLQLLAERAQYITGASGAAIALREGESMVCCASVGSSAPELGAHLQIDSGLSAESVRTRQILLCNDAATDPRVNRESCQAFGIASVVVMPLVRGEEVYGVFELLSGRPHAFEERDFVAVKRLSEIIQTAVEHAEAARRAEKDPGGKPEPEIAASFKAELATAKPASQLQTGTPEASPTEQAPLPKARTVIEEAEPETPIASATVLPSEPVLAAVPEPAANDDEKKTETDQSRTISTIAYGNLRRCETCGFPVSEGRRLCLDCEAANPTADPGGSEVPEFFTQLGDSNASWIRSHAYWVATVLIVAATVAVLIWRF